MKHLSIEVLQLQSGQPIQLDLADVWLDLVLNIALIGLIRRWAYIHFAVAIKPDKNVLGKTQAEVKEKLKKALEQCREVDNPYRFS